MGRTATISFARHPAIQNIYSLDEGQGCRIDWDALSDSYRAGSGTVTVNGAAAGGATSVNVDALPVSLDKGDTLSFGSGEFARLTASAASGATTIAVEPLLDGLEDNDTAAVGGEGPKVIPALTVMSYVAGGEGLAQPRSFSGADASFILASEAVEGALGVGYTGYGSYVSGQWYENLLPDAVGGALPDAYKTELEANSGRHQYFTYRDSRSD